jgi:nucleoside-diphosphate-sugar epimerase
LKGDIRNEKDVLEACIGKDVVFHTVALVNYWSKYDFDKEKMFAINVKGTEVRFV